MAPDLPDEILSEILTPLLKVPESLFSHTGPDSLFALGMESTSALLLVCKAWLRVSTPLLYNVVILRSKAQAQALQGTLLKNGNLGKFIKKLRVEGGFGSAMHSILQRASGIVDLFISLYLRANDSSSGLVSGLSEINPQRLILHDQPSSPYSNKSVVQLAETLAHCAHKWTNLVRFFLASLQKTDTNSSQTTIVLPYRDVLGTVRRYLVKGICSAPTVKTVAIPSMTTVDHVPPHIFDIASNPSVETIEIDMPAERIIPAVHYEINAHPRLKATMKWTADWTFEPRPVRQIPILQPAHPSFSPMTSTPRAIADTIWTRVLFFAMIAEKPLEHPLHVLDQYKHNQKVNSRRLPFLFVSKMFHRLGIPLLYGYPLFADRYHPRAFSEQLKADPSLGMHLREMTTRKGLLFGTYAASDTVDMLPIVSCSPHLTHLIGEASITMRWDAFAALAKTAGGALLEFTGYNVVGEGDSAPPSGDVFSCFTTLRFLRWGSDINFSIESVDASSMGLGALEVLEVDSCQIFAVCVIFTLPNLRRLIVHGSTTNYEPFLRKHGHKITELVVCDQAVENSSFFALCPNMRTMTLRLREHHTNGLNFFQLVDPQTHVSLEQMVIEKYPKRLKADEEKEWTNFFSTVDASHFPALKEIQCVTCKWPTTEHAISKSFWVKWAEKLLDRGIKLTDAAAVSWRPRLKAARR